MVRGPKKHLKRLNAPRHWMLDKLGGVFAPKPAPGALLPACSAVSVGWRCNETST